VSILTSRHLLVELNVHFPLHLHLIQLAAAAIPTAAVYLLSRGKALASHPPNGPQSVLYFAVAAVTAASLLFFT
jgi:hypothetical protein